MHRLLDNTINFDRTNHSKLGHYHRFFKRITDIIVVFIMAPIAVIIIIPLAIITSFDGSKPFYWQKRVGKNGRIFHMLKLRNDPRITRLGRFIRKTSIDELPQIWNVLKGEMSMVGPRPIMQSQRRIYPGSEYYKMRPGITGFWQVSDRNECSFSKRARFDADYLNRLSFVTDLFVMLQTVMVVIRATGV